MAFEVARSIRREGENTATLGTYVINSFVNLCYLFYMFATVMHLRTCFTSARVGGRGLEGVLRGSMGISLSSTNGLQSGVVI